MSKFVNGVHRSNGLCMYCGGNSEYDCNCVQLLVKYYPKISISELEKGEIYSFDRWFKNKVIFIEQQGEYILVKPFKIHSGLIDKLILDKDGNFTVKDDGLYTDKFGKFGIIEAENFKTAYN